MRSFTAKSGWKLSVSSYKHKGETTMVFQNGESKDGRSICDGDETEELNTIHEIAIIGFDKDEAFYSYHEMLDR